MKKQNDREPAKLWPVPDRATAAHASGAGPASLHIPAPGNRPKLVRIRAVGWPALLLALLLLSTVACRGPQWNTFEDEELGISVRYPADWENRGNESSDLDLFMNDREVGNAIISISSQAELRPANVEEYLMERISQRAEYLADDNVILEHFLVETPHGERPVTQTIYYIFSAGPMFTFEVHHAVVELPTGYLAIETSSPGSGAEKAMNLLLENVAYEER